MPLRHADPPPEATAAVMGSLERLTGHPPETLRALAESDPVALRLEKPHEVYTLGLTDIRSRRPLDRAVPTGWRYLLHDESGAVSSAETVVTEGGEQRFASFTRGPFVAATIDALNSSDEMAVADDEDVEPRVLNVPGLNLMALWLKSSTQDVLIPLAPAPPEVEAGRRYAPAELFRRLREPAQARASIGPEDLTGG